MNTELSKKLRSKAIEIACLYHLTAEKTGHNDGALIEKFQEYNNSLKGAPWCACFVSFCFKEAAEQLKIERPFYQIAGVNYLASFAKKQNWYHDGSSFLPLPGDIFVHVDLADYSKSHTGFVKELKDGKIITMEGNVSNQVSSRRFLHNDSYLTGFIRVTV
jgi:hypothetical protein